MARQQDFEPLDFLVPFGLVAIIVGFWFLYAVFAPFPMEPVSPRAGEDCEVTNSPGVHFSTDWTLEFRNACGDPYPGHRVYYLGFTIAGVLLIYGGTRTVWEKL